jgi:hypothetical protein
MSSSSRPPGEVPADLQARYRALAAELADIGFLARGSVFATTTTCSSKGCHCRTHPARRHGPYWQWSRSAGGTTRTTRLSETEVLLYREWIANRRRVETILTELEQLSAQAAASLLGARDLPGPSGSR